MQIRLGARIYYAGDRANAPSYGTIVAVCQDSVDILYDEPRFDGDTRLSRGVPLVAFKSAAYGQRFWLADEWKAERERQMEIFRRRMKTK